MDNYVDIHRVEEIKIMNSFDNRLKLK